MNEVRPGRAVVPEGAWAQSVRLGFGFLFVAVAVMALGWAASGIRRIPPDSRAVVVRLGQVARASGPGLLLAWPPPIDRVVLLPSADGQFALRIARFDAGTVVSGRRAEYRLSSDPRRNAGFLLTGDAGVVHLQATLFYRISDPAAFLIERDHVAAALERLFVAGTVEVCAARTNDAILMAPATTAGSRFGGPRPRAAPARSGCGRQPSP